MAGGGLECRQGQSEWRWAKEGSVRSMGITEEEIMAWQTPKGGWTKDTLAEWGIPWPPPKGWKKGLLRRAKRLADISQPPPVDLPAVATPQGRQRNNDGTI